VAVGFVGNVANLLEGRQPLIADDAHQLGRRDDQSANRRKFQGASRNIRVDEGWVLE
jgi:hypothetical protein